MRLFYSLLLLLIVNGEEFLVEIPTTNVPVKSASASTTMKTTTTTTRGTTTTKPRRTIKTSETSTVKSSTTTTTTTTSATTSKYTSTVSTTTVNALAAMVKQSKDIVVNLREAKRQMLIKIHGHCFDDDRSSPIDIDLATTEEVNLPEPLEFIGYSEKGPVHDSYSQVFSDVKQGFTMWRNPPKIRGGPLTGEFFLHEVHWSYTSMMSMGNPLLVQNSHTINGAEHSTEVHFVHTINGIPLKEAEKIPGGVVIVAVFFTTTMQNSTRDFGNWTKIKGDNSTRYTYRYDWVRLDELMPEDRSTYFYYNGSYLFPPCNNVVQWILLADPVHITLMQMSQLFDNIHGMYSLPVNLYVDLPKPRRQGVYMNRVFKAKTASESSSPTLVVCLVVIVLILMAGILMLIACNYELRKRANNKVQGFDNIALDPDVIYRDH